jgi:hypothetical protein
MNVTYRLAGIDGEATEDRVESLTDESQSEAALLKKIEIAAVLAKPISETEEEGVMTTSATNGITGVQVILNCFEDIHSLKQQRYYAEQLFRLLMLITKVQPVRQSILKSDQHAI